MAIRPIAFVGAEELGRGEGADDPAREQPHAGDDEGAAGDEPGDDGGVGAARLVVVADRVGERRPGELEAADEHVDPLGELDRERVEAGLGEAGGADDDDPVDEVEQVERELGRHRRQAEAHQPPQQRPVEAQREAAPVDEDQAERRRRRRWRSCRAAGRGRPRPGRRRGRRSAPIAASTLRIVVMKKARARSSRRKRVSRYSNIVSTQRPPIEIRARSGADSAWSSASEIGPAKGSAISAATVENQNSAAKEVETTAGRVLVVLVVEAQQRLDQAEADDDAGRDDARRTSPRRRRSRRGEVARVERQQRDRDQLRDDARRGVGGAGRR